MARLPGGHSTGAITGFWEGGLVAEPPHSSSWPEACRLRCTQYDRSRRRTPVDLHGAVGFDAVAASEGLCQQPSEAMSSSACFGPQVPGL
jgi:hypothetical protein